jgi:nicotinate-nucleotide adenylyltransferase
LPIRALFIRKMNKIGIFGGAFNPIHNGHLFVAKESLKVFGLRKIIFVPTGNPVFTKEDLLPKETRAYLVKIAIKDESYFEESLFEIDRDEPSYYIETLEQFEDSENDLFTIVGEDAFLFFHKWKSYQDIILKTNFIIAERFDDSFKTTKNYIEKNFPDFEKKIFFLPHPLYRISSTLIRERIKSNKHISYLVSEEVEREILNKKFYKNI